MTWRSLDRRALRERIGRRQLLAGAGGVALGLPLLQAFSAKAEESAPPKRLLLIFTPNGVIEDAWWPVNVTAETSWDLGEIHQPLAPYKERLTFLRGVDLKITSTGPGGLHQRGIGGLYTGRELQAGEQFVDGCGQRAGWANGISVDQEVAKHIGQGTLLTSLELGVHALDNDVQGRIAYAGPGLPLPPMNDPAAVFDRLFTAEVPGDAAGLLRQQRRSVLDTVQEQFLTLAPRLSIDDRIKLDQHLTLVRDVERRLTENPAVVGGCDLPERANPIDPADPANMPAIADLELDLLALAFACDLTRVASFQISTSLNRLTYPFLGGSGEGHSLSHTGPSNATARTEMVRRHTWQSERLARLLSALASTTELDGSSVLDNTLAVWCSEVSLGSTHTHTNMPFLIVGGGWHFRTGRSIEYQGASHSDLLVSLLQAMGVEATTFGHPDFVTGPLSGLV